VSIDSVGRRLQGLQTWQQTLSLARLAQARSGVGLFSPSEVDALFDDIGLPRPGKISNILASLEKKKLLTRVKNPQAGAAWKLTPEGKGQAEDLATDMDLAVLLTEASGPAATLLGDTEHPVIPPSLAPPALIKPLHTFLEKYPFETNVFGMTRFPVEKTDGKPDPVGPALEAAKKVCEKHGLTFHLASDRQIVPELWPNVAAHMWGCRYGVAFFEAVSDMGLNYNLNIEVGSCLVLGRRLALLKDKSLEKMPTDLVGQIFYEVKLDKPTTVTKQLDAWITTSLA
jgi:DNA-binding MarR family transcriptional regulator